MLKFAVAIQLAFTGETTAMENMKQDFVQRVEAHARGEAPAATIAERTGYDQWLAAQEEFMALERRALFVEIPETNVVT